MSKFIYKDEEFESIVKLAQCLLSFSSLDESLDLLNAYTKAYPSNGLINLRYVMSADPLFEIFSHYHENKPLIDELRESIEKLRQNVRDNYRCEKIKILEAHDGLMANYSSLAD